MISLTRRPIQMARVGLGQFSNLIDPLKVAGETEPTTPPVPVAAQDAAKPLMVITGLGLTALSAATAFVGISYGLEKKNSELERALGWTVGVVGAMSGLVRLVGTTALLFLSPSSMSGRRP